MSQDEQIETTIISAIDIIEQEIVLVRAKQNKEGLEATDITRVLECLKVLVVVQKDKRASNKENIIDIKALDKTDLDRMIDEEAEKERLKSLGK